MRPHIGEIKALTGVRGLAALWVVLYHVHAMDGVTGVAGTVLRHGYMAVDLFFMLSGFILALSYERFFVSGWNRVSYAIFLIRRFARVYPLYILTTLLVALGIAAGLSGSLPREGLAGVLAANVLMIQAWGMTDSINGVAWSISTEFAAYLLFPLLCWIMLKGAWWRAIGAAVVCVAAILLIAQQPTPADIGERMGPLDVFWHRSPWPLLRCLVEFSLGLFTYRLAQVAGVRAWASHGGASLAMAVLVFFLAALPGYDVAFVVSLAGLILLLAEGDNLPSRFFGSRIMFFLGEISFAIYLLHFQFLRVRWMGTAKLTPHLGPLAAEWVSIGVLYISLIVCAWLAYRFVERPARRWLRGAEARIDANGR